MPDLSQTLVTPRGLVTVTAEAEAPRRGWRRWLGRWRRRPEPARDHRAFREFIGDHWLELSAAAYRGYRRHGAGAAVVLTEPVERGPIRPGRLAFVTQVHSLPGASRADFDGWAARQLEQYDPEAEALVVFAEPARIVGFLVRGSVPPPEALRTSSAPLN